jgi:hypothetical protein
MKTIYKIMLAQACFVVNVAVYAEAPTPAEPEKAQPKTDNGSWYFKGYYINWEKCQEDIKKHAPGTVDGDHLKADMKGESKDIVTPKGTVSVNTKEEELYQSLLKHDTDLAPACNENCHTPYERATGKEG